MPRQDKIQKLLVNNHRRLQALQERKALYGLETPIAILTEIQDIEAEIERLEAELKQIEADQSSPPANETKPRRRVKATRPPWLWLGLGGALLLAIIVIIIIVWAGNSQNKMPPTEAAVAISTPTSTPSPAPTATPIPPTSTFTPVPPTPTPSPTFTPVPPTATSTSTPVFVTEYLFPAQDIQQIELNTEAGMLPTETITNFLKLSRVAFGTFDDKGMVYQVRLVIKNTGERPLLLDLDQRFFKLEDSEGNSAELLHFCCVAKGAILSPGQEREMVLSFRSVGGWFVKEEGPSSIYFYVRGLLPVIRAVWEIRKPAVAA